MWKILHDVILKTGRCATYLTLQVKQRVFPQFSSSKNTLVGRWIQVTNTQLVREHYLRAAPAFKKELMCLSPLYSHGALHQNEIFTRNPINRLI